MSIADFIADLRRRDIRLTTEGERLRVNAPKGTLTGELREQIAERKTEILGFLHSNAANFALPPIRRVAKDQPSPLSFAQERLWFLEQLEPAGAAYNICRAARLTGHLEVKSLESSLTEILRRHEVLRATFAVVDGRTMQIMVPAQKFSIPLIDFRQLSHAEREEEAARLISEEARHLFDLSAGPLLRATLLRLGDDDHILILTTHHIVSDAWSMGILQREIAALYENFSHGKPASLPELSVQYGDYAAWQREWLQGEVLESQRSYWKEQLGNLPPVSLPTDRPRPPRQAYRGARKSIVLSQSLTAKLKELGEQAGATLFMTLVAAFKTLLHRYTGQEDVALGSPVASRNRTEIQGLIGFFVNTLVLRTDLSGTPTFRDLLGRIRDTCLGAYANLDLPFEKLVEELQPERDLSRNPLFQVMFALQNAPRSLPKLSDLAWTRIDVDSGTSKFDLSLALADRENRLSGFFEYSTDLFDDSTIERMIGHLQTLLKGIVDDPDQAISTLPLLTQPEQHQLLVEWNDTKTEYPKDSCVHELFEAQVERAPGAIAIEFEAEHLTYRELNIRANRLAHYLRGLGVGPEKLVGICVERSLETVVGLLGILKAGGAYLPLDPVYPAERLSFMLQDAQVTVLLTQEKLLQSYQLSAISSQDALPVTCLDRDWEEIARQSDENPPKEVTAENLAYVIYTSGSTGTPKGVAIEHRNTVNLLNWAGHTVTTQELAGVLASTSICFDLSVFEIFVPLCAGGRAILAENALCLPSVAARNEVALINTVPSIMAELMALGEVPDSVRIINLAGEPLRPELVKRIYESDRVEKVYDLYGPSETTTYSTVALRTANGPQTIGRPIANTKIYILDRNLQPVPVGVSGELYIGGAGVARGYLNRPELTTERFIPNPFAADGSERLYNTGDLARYRSDGNIEFLGRVDHQVKIHGYRIELGEIEAVLNQHPGVSQAVVVLRERESTVERSLVSYVVPRQQSASLVSELRNVLKGRLPEYMIPSAFVTLDALPLLPNGKVDRAKLPLPDDGRPQSAHEAVPPRTEIEELIAQTWREVLKIENVGIYDNFFELGGHSLLATQIVARLRETFDREIPLSALFDAPTVADLSVEVEKTLRDGDAPALPPIIPVPRDGPLPLSMNQEHLWRLDQMMPGTHFFNMPYIYRLSGELNISALEKAIHEIFRRHEALRTVFPEINGQPGQIIKDLFDFELPYVDLRSDSADEVSEKAAGLVSEERDGPFDLASGPLIRIKTLRLTETEYFLLVTVHHIISDHWSMQVFRRELATLYGAFCKGRPSPLGETQIQFADYSVWERTAVESRFLQRQLEYWVKQLAEPYPKLKPRKKFEHRQPLSFQMSCKSIELDETEFAAVEEFARHEKVTPFMVVVTALSVLFYSATKERDVRVGTLVANRRQSEADGTIGHFLNTVVLRIHIDPSMVVREVLKQIRGVILGAFAHQDLPFELLARKLEAEKNIDREAIFPVLLSYQKASVESNTIPGLRIAPVGLMMPNTDLEITPTACDLVLKVREASTKLTGAVNYKTFDGNDVGAFVAKHFCEMLRVLPVQGAARIAEIFPAEKKKR